MTPLFDWLLWIAIIASTVILLAICRRFRTDSSLPWFWRFLCFTVLKSFYLFGVALTGNEDLFGLSKSLLDVGSAVIILLVAHEIWRKVFGPKNGLPKWAGKRFRYGLLITYPSCLAIGVSFRLNTPSDWLDFIVNFQFIANAAMAATLIMMIMYSRRLRITWRARLAGISSGFVLMMLGDTLAAFVIARGMNPLVAQRADQFIGLTALVWWSCVLWGREPVRQKPTPDIVDAILNEHRRTMGAATVLFKQ